MKVDLNSISFALERILKQSEVASFGAFPLLLLTEHWESIALRSSDLDAGIKELDKQGRLCLETHSDGVWVRRQGKGGPPQRTIQRLQAYYRRLMGFLMFAEVGRRKNDGYSGFDRRLHRRPPTSANYARSAARWR